jgi:hypothetical protein
VVKTVKNAMLRREPCWSLHESLLRSARQRPGGFRRVGERLLSFAARTGGRAPTVVIEVIARTGFLRASRQSSMVRPRGALAYC